MGNSEFIGTAKVPTSEVRTVYITSWYIVYVTFNDPTFASSLIKIVKINHGRKRHSNAIPVKYRKQTKKQ